METRSSSTSTSERVGSGRMMGRGRARERPGPRGFRGVATGASGGPVGALDRALGYQSTRSPASHPRVAAGTSTGTSASTAS
jgi:hypothetical protein